MTEIKTILVLGIITALLTGAASAMMTTTQTAEARVNDCSRNSDTYCEAGGGSFQEEGLVGGSGSHRQCDATLTTCSTSFGRGFNSDNSGEVGGSGGHSTLTGGTTTDRGGSGDHVQGPGGNSGN